MPTNNEANTQSTAPVEAAPQSEDKALATTVATDVAHPIGQMFDDIDGEIDKDDIIIPRLALCQKGSNLQDDFPVGSWVMNKTNQIAELGDEVPFTPIAASKYYQENTEYEAGGAMPRRFRTAAEAQDAGLRLDFDDETGEKPEVQKCLDLTILIRWTGKDGASMPPEFNLNFGGEYYAMVMYSMSSWSSYQNAARWILSARQMHMPTLNHREWTIHSEKSQLKNGNTFFIPRVKQGQENTADFKAWANGLVGK